MPVYTVREVTGNAKPHNHLEERGLKARSVSMTSLDPIALADFPQIAYKIYTTLLPAFMLATKQEVVLPTSRPGYNLIERVQNSIPVPFPNLVVSFEQTLTADEVTTMTNLGFAEFGKKGSAKMYSIKGNLVTQDILSTVYKHKKKVKTMCSKPVGACNLQDYQALFKVLGIVTWFLKTHSYPAFSGPVDEKEEEQGGRYDAIDGLVSAKRKGTFLERTGKRVRLDEGEEEMEIDDAEIDASGMEEYNLGTGEDHIPKAKPSSVPESIFGPISSIPTIPGILFPYFMDILSHDTNFVASTIRAYFLESLGDTRDDIIAGYNAIKGGLGTIAMTETGDILQHIFCGVKLAIESQARVYLIINEGKYLGFTLHGWYFTVSIDGYKHRPLEYKELLAEVRLVDEHAISVAHILSALMKLKLKSTNKTPSKKYIQDRKEGCLKNPRELARLLQEMQLNDDEALAEIEKQANKLAYPQRFWDVNAENILKAVDLLLAKELPALDVPMYTRGGVLSSSDPALSVMSAFGFETFSFRNPGGNPVRVPEESSKDTLFAAYKGKGGKLVNPNPPLILAKKNLGLAVDDWKAFVNDHLYFHKTTRDSAYRCYTIGGIKAKELWHGLINRIGPIETSGKNIAADEVVLGDEIVGEHGDDFLDFM